MEHEPEKVIQVKDDFYILASSSLADEQTQVLKHADTFAIFDRHGDIRPLGFEDHGLFHEGTRFLSYLHLTLNGKSPLLLSSRVSEDNEMLQVDLTNADFEMEHSELVRKGSVHISRSIFLRDGTCHERVLITNYAPVAGSLWISLHLAADYMDIFEVRGMKRQKRGDLLKPIIDEHGLILSYQSLDRKIRKTYFRFSPRPQQTTDSNVAFQILLYPHQQAAITMRISCIVDEKISPSQLQADYDVARRQALTANQSRHEDVCLIETSNEQFNDWLNGSSSDLSMLLTETPQGRYPYAGIPWFSTIFGRDGIITELETLWVDPSIARGVLNYLAAHQAEQVDPKHDAEPGKILHEQRKGEMAALGEIPFGTCYGSVDATPLFVILAGRYLDQTADAAFIERIWPNIKRALDWMDHFGDCDGDGFLEYRRTSESGLINQGWRDSNDAIFHADGSLCEPPIALSEVQAYAYEAKIKASYIAEALGEAKVALQCKREAVELKQKFSKLFWCDELNTFAMGLDGKKKPCLVRSSSAGHCLAFGIAAEEQAQKVASQLLEPSFFTGFGIRTLAATEKGYNPMSYHNGSVWPHDEEGEMKNVQTLRKQNGKTKKLDIPIQGMV